MKKLVFLGLLVCSWQAPASATTRTAASCSVADIQEQVKKSADGDTVLVPGGSSTWRTTLTIKVGITLNGQGCVVTWPASPPFGYLYVYANTVANTLITGFTFNGSYPAAGSCGGPIHLVSSDSPLTMPYRFYGSTLNVNAGGPSNSDVTLCPFGTGPGLIDHNIWNGSYGEWIQVWGGSTGFDETRWTSDVVPGGPNMVFIEDNTFNNTNPTFVAGVAAYYGAKYVFRHNNVTFFSLDAHAGNSSGVGTRWVEIYQNNFTIPTVNGQSAFWTIRGGSGVSWGNHVLNGCGNNQCPIFLLGPFLKSSDSQTGNWPLPYQAGRGIESPIGKFSYSPFYSWGNDALMGSRSNCAGLGGLCSNYPAYVQIGNSPSSSLCTAQASTNHAANVCDGIEFGPSTSTPPSLLRCESAADLAAGCPVSYVYTPYTYPHPLQNSGTTPAPPVKLSVTVTQ
jgi:hypothetical protein